MPYKDPDKQRAAVRESARRRRGSVRKPGQRAHTPPPGAPAVRAGRKKDLRPVSVPAAPGERLNAILGAAAQQALQPDASPHDVAVAAKAAKEAVEAFGKARDAAPRRPALADVEPPRTVDEARALLSRIGCGQVQAEASQVSALRAAFPGLGDAGADDAGDEQWLADSAAFERRVAEAYHLEEFGGEGQHE